jgi:5'-nucleotidase
MPFPIENKLVIGIASSALFDLTDADAVFRKSGEEAYRRYQEDHLEDTLPKGVAFPFIRRFLNLNKQLPDSQPVEVVLLSRNSPETGLRVFRSIEHYGLDITRAAFFSGTSPFMYNDAFNLSLFLSANKADVQQAVLSGFPAGLVLKNDVEDDPLDNELRLAFDFDGVLANDEAERIYQTEGLAAFSREEALKRKEPLGKGPLADLFSRIALIQQLQEEARRLDPTLPKCLKIAIVTARNAPAHERMINTLKSWHLSVDEAFFLGGIEKRRVLSVMRPHMYFDDQTLHLERLDNIPMVHIPFGVANEPLNP